MRAHPHISISVSGCCRHERPALTDAATLLVGCLDPGHRVLTKVSSVSSFVAVAKVLCPKGSRGVGSEK